jgi:ubiquinone/menaquinone biosynthesis C-methylase UbiE
MEEISTEKIESLVRDYYTDYYRDQLGIPDWKARVERRIHEKELYGSHFLSQVISWFNLLIDESTQVLVVGAGTGSDFFALLDTGANVYAIEPNVNAVQILQLKAIKAAVTKGYAIQSVAETLPFPDNSFDLTWCFTVVEHVQNVERSIEEMIRVTKPGGYIYINTPDYRQFYEAHYKMTLPMFLPKWIIRLYLRIRKRPPTFVDTLQFVTEKQITNILQNQPVISFFVVPSWGEKWKKHPTIRMRLIMLISKVFTIHYNQIWVIKKLEM